MPPQSVERRSLHGGLPRRGGRSSPWPSPAVATLVVLSVASGLLVAVGRSCATGAGGASDPNVLALVIGMLTGIVCMVASLTIHGRRMIVLVFGCGYFLACRCLIVPGSRLAKLGVALFVAAVLWNAFQLARPRKALATTKSPSVRQENEP